MKLKFFYTFVLSALVMAALGLGLGCGKKGPPLPPLNEGNILAPPTDLTYTLNNRQVILTWTHRVDPVRAKIKPEGYEIFMATKDMEGCEGCPFIFKSVGIVSMPDTSFQYKIGNELKFYFRIQALGENDVKSTYSKTLFIDDKPNE
jgi:predicted small lipoprotein YifL